MIKDFHNIRIVLSKTSHPGNIGAAARALKTMGLQQLYLVQPKQFPHAKAVEMAAGADDLLAETRVFNTLDEAIAECSLVIGASARLRSIPWPLLDPRECGVKAIEAASTNNKVAIIFGNERNGLDNCDLHRCHYHVHIPANPDYSSLNLAAAVQVICYELRMATTQAIIPSEPIEWADSATLTRFYDELETTLLAIDFLNPKSPRQLLPRLRRLFNRARLEQMEVAILRGILSGVRKYANLS